MKNGVFGVALLAIAFSITSNAVALNITFAERWLYWPMVGLLIALTAALDFAINHRPHVRTPALAVGWIAVVVCGVLTISQNRIWHDEATLYEEVIARGGDTARVRANLAGYYLETGQIEKARAHLEKARQKNPDHAQVLRVMGMLLSAEGDFSAATNWFVRAQAVEPSNPAIPIWLATCQEQLGDLAAAEATLHTATLRSSGGLPELRLANFYYRHEKFEEAERALRDLLQRDPQSAAAHNTLGTVLFRKGDPSAARRHFLSALRYDRWLVDAHANLAALADAQGDLVQAKKYYRDALHLAPQNAELHYALAVLLAHHGQRGDAQRALEHALELDPHLESARQLLNTLNQQKAN